MVVRMRSNQIHILFFNLQFDLILILFFCLPLTAYHLSTWCARNRANGLDLWNLFDYYYLFNFLRPFPLTFFISNWQRISFLIVFELILTMVRTLTYIESVKWTFFFLHMHMYHFSTIQMGVLVIENGWEKKKNILNNYNEHMIYHLANVW